MKDTTRTGVHWYGDRNRWDKPWRDLIPEAGCAMDFLASSALLEWLDREKALKIEKNDSSRLSRYREFSKLVEFKVVVPQLVLFENVFLSIGTFYKENIDYSALQSQGFIKEFPRPHEGRFFPMYKLLSPVVSKTIATELERIAGKPYSEIWTPKGEEARQELRNYEGLARWLFAEFSKDVCGIPPNEGQLIERLLPGLAFQFFDFVEYATSGQGHFLDAPVPYVSSILKPSKAPGSIPKDSLPHQENAFALYQLAASDALGFQPVVNTFDDVLRLRESKEVGKIRDLLGLYRGAANRKEDEVLAEITQEIVAARNAIKRFEFTESSTYTYGATALNFVPLVGTVVSVLTGTVQVLKDIAKRKHGWIYFGVK